MSEWDRYCAKCGNLQGAGAPPPPPGPKPEPSAQTTESPAPVPPPPTPTASIRPNHAALLCYIPQIGWVASVLFMSIEPYSRNRYVRFHALQGLFLFVLYLLAQTVFGFIPVSVVPFKFFSFRRILELAVVVAQVLGIVRCARGEDYRLPILSELAEKSMV